MTEIGETSLGKDYIYIYIGLTRAFFLIHQQIPGALLVFLKWSLTSSICFWVAICGVKIPVSKKSKTACIDYLNMLFTMSLIYTSITDVTF